MRVTDAGAPGCGACVYAASNLAPEEMPEVMGGEGRGMWDEGRISPCGLDATPGDPVCLEMRTADCGIRKSFC